MKRIEDSTVNITVNNVKIAAEKGESILEAAKKAGIKIPSLCYFNMHNLDVLNRPASCRVCMVEQVGGRRGRLVPACATFVSEGMVINTNSKKAVEARRTIVELMLSDHPSDCLSCVRNKTCELLSLAADLGIREVRYKGETNFFHRDTSSYSVVRDPAKCVLCRRCESMCTNVQSVGVLSGINRGFDTIVGTAFDTPLIDTQCTFCGQCVAVCPTGALTTVGDTREVWNVVNDPDKYVVVQTAPAIRAALGEMFGMPAGQSVTGKMVSALRRLGFDKVFDTNFAADVTVLEESTEFLHRLKNRGKLPLITSCCPSWVKFIEHQYPDLIEHPSSCRSPQETFGALAKTYLAEKLGVDPGKIVCVSIMPCLAKKYEAHREELKREEYPNVDFVLSTRELGHMIKEAGIELQDLPEEKFDTFMGESSGASVIFGAAGGILEAVLRTAYETTTGKRLGKIELDVLRGFSKGIKEAVINLGGIDVKVASANELKNTRKLMEDIRDGKSEYHLIEITACPGGCIAGGGQPYHYASEEVLNKRRDVLYDEDRNNSVRRSHENPEVQKLYEEFLGHPGSEKSHNLIHTKYVKRSI